MTSNKLAALGALLLLAACARNSPALPPDLSHLSPEQRLLAGDAESPEATMDCAALKDEAARNRVAKQQYEGVIHGNRGQNQAAAFIGGAVFLPAYLATKGDEDAKKNLDQLQAQADRIDRLSKAKACPM